MNERLRRMDDERIARLEERVSNWMEQTTEYRKALCAKLDKVMEKLDNLPCDLRHGRWESLNAQIKWVWGLLCAMIIAVVGEWINKK